jgi:hypothetical protein
MTVTVETLSLLAAVGVPVLSFAGAWAAIKVHLFYIRRDLDQVIRSARAAHWRLDEIQAPPAPTVHR